MLQSLVERFRRGDRLALSRLVSLVAAGERAGIEGMFAELGVPEHPARVVAITGAGGVGKSSLTGKLIEEIRRQGPTVGVLACDPESPLSGGALLGDRFRMSARPEDDGVFIRSLAAAGGQGALARHLSTVVRLLEAFGFGVVLLETVGAGQGDTVVRDLADVVVVLLQPETGDDLQWEKAGLLEVADVVVVHKADLPGAERVEAQLVAGLALSAREPPPVLRVSSRSGMGIAELWQVIKRRPLRRGLRKDADELYRLLRDTLDARLVSRREAVLEVVARWQMGTKTTAEAVTELGAVLLRSND